MVAISRVLRLRPIHRSRIHYTLHNLYSSTAAPDSVPNSSPPPPFGSILKLLLDSFPESVKQQRPPTLDESRRKLSVRRASPAADSPPSLQPDRGPNDFLGSVMFEKRNELEKRILVSKLLKTEKKDRLVRNAIKTEKNKENSLWSEELGDMINSKSLRKNKAEIPEEGRKWTQVSEVSLKLELDSLMKQGFKIGSMVKNGHVEQIEQALRKYESCQGISQQDIISKIMAWKREFETLNGLISCDGIRFVKSRKEIAVDSEEAWNAYVKLQPEAKTMRDKVFHLYDTWKKLFSEDHITGKVKENFAKRGNHSLNMGEEEAVTAIGSDANETDAPTGSKDRESPDNEKKTAKKKRKSVAESVVEPLLKQMQDLFSNQIEEMKTILSSTKQLQKPSPVSDMYTLLEAIPELSLEQRIKVAMRLVKQRQELELFLGLPDDARAKFIEMIVQEMS